MNSEISKNVLTAIDIFSTKERVEDTFVPLLLNSNLKSSFTKLAKDSPIFQKSLNRLKDTLGENDFNSFIKRYLEFYSNVNILSDELSLIVENNFSRVEDKKITLSQNGESHEVSSRSVLGSMFFLIVSSNEDTFDRSLNKIEGAL